MSYNAYITRIKNVRKHSNADRLLVGECFGNSIIVGLDTQEGDLGIYFPTDGKLGLDYAKSNKLLREKDENGNNVGGYLDPEKRHITTIKLRGEQSDGLFMPIKSLSGYVDINSLKEGDLINTLNGVLICEKYVPRGKKPRTQNSAKDKRKKVNTESYPFFEEHVDTSQLAYNTAKFKPGDICTISLKMHGCFNGNTRVKLWNKNKAIRMYSIKQGDIVVGYKNGKFVPSKVLNVFKNGKTKEWVRLGISRSGYAGESMSKIECTPNHKFWVNNKEKYVEAKNLNTGDEIHTVVQSKILNDLQKQILVGKYLGDGYYLNAKQSGCLQFSHKQDHEDYLDYTIQSLGNIAHKQNGIYISGYGTKMIRGKTIQFTDMKLFFNKILSVDNNNKLSENIVKYFTPISLAFLYMDDGSLQHSNSQQDRSAIAICDYNEHDAKIISKCLTKLGLESKIYKDSEGYNRIRLNLDASNKMFEMIANYIPQCMKYKLPEKYRNHKTISLVSNSETGYVFIPNKIIKKEFYNVSRGNEKYDIETETHNYVVHDCLVHNSSGRTAYTIKEKKRILPYVIHRMLKTLGVKLKIKKTWEYVSGTRRVVLKNYDGGFYGSNAFRSKWHDLFIGKLRKGEEIFYEIVGYTDDGKLIMPECNNKKTKDKEFIKQYGDTTRFTYGCNVGESDVYVYRINMTNEDGDTVEYPSELVKIRCEQMGVKYCPQLETFIFTTVEDLMERVNKYLDGVDLIGKTHIREGIVVRVENKEKFTVYKHKNFNFKVLEGIIKSEDVLDMEEENSVGDDNE